MKLFKISIFILLLTAFNGLHAQQSGSVDLKAFHGISSHDLLDYAAELSSDQYGGRLSGSPGYTAAAQWVAGRLKEWGVKPAAGSSGYFQHFPNAWTEVLNPGSVLIFPAKEKGGNPIALKFPDEYYPGSNSGSGTAEGEVVYAGFGITAPELGYDDYAGMDVRGKIVMIESGVPYTQNDKGLAQWEPYSYHRYKFQRARELGAAGLLYVGLTANPNTSYLEGFVYAHIAEDIAEELFRDSGKTFAGMKPEIVKAMKPSSLSLKRRVAITATTRHYPEALSCNVVGIIEGTDPLLKEEAIIIGGHLDGVGSPGMVFPGALDNASGVADILGAARALAMSEVKPLRTVIFIFFGGEECGLYGASKFVEDPLWPKEKTVFMMNLDMVGNGTGFHLSGGLSHPDIYRHFEEANRIYLHRDLRSSEVRQSFGRPRTDGAVFEKAGYPTLGLWTTGSVKTVYYHHPLDNIDGLTPEIMEDAAKLLYTGILGVANDRTLKLSGN
ncbi:MAG: M28 family peptidase [Bacteroidota bacterium]